MNRFVPKKILVPFDFSEVSMAAWEEARVLAARFAARIAVLYVEDLLPRPFFDAGSDRLSPALKREVTDHLRSKLGHEAELHVLRGDPTLLILRLSRIIKPDLIVMGSNGRSGLERFRYGSVAVSVARLSQVPVMSLRCPARPIGSILVPVGLAEHSETIALYASDLGAAFGARLSLLHVDRHPGLSKLGTARLMALIHRLKTARQEAAWPRSKTRGGSVVDEIVKEAQGHDLIVMPTGRKGFFEGLFLGTATEQVIRRSMVPVLSVPVAHAPRAGASMLFSAR